MLDHCGSAHWSTHRSRGQHSGFIFGSLLTLVMVIVYTRLGTTPPIGLVMLVSVLMFVGVSARMISSKALVFTIPAAASRGAFMSVSSSIQQASGGIAAALAGWIVVAPAAGPLQNFDKVGDVVVGATLATMAMMFWLSRPAGAARPRPRCNPSRARERIPLRRPQKTKPLGCCSAGCVHPV